MIPLLFKASQALNVGRTIATIPKGDLQVEKDKYFLFGRRTSQEETTKGQLQKELNFLFKRLVIDAHDLEDGPFEWWRVNEVVFSNMGFLVCQYLAIPSSQIESERIFLIVGILSNIRHSTCGNTEI